MALPNLVLAGFPKCGTTSVAETLVRHPEVCGSFPHLRTRYFTPLLYDPAAVLPPIKDYERHYSHCQGERVRLDDTAVWMYGGQPMAKRVRDVLGDAKVLVMLREPVSRTSSYLAWKKRHGEISQDMDLAEYIHRCEQHGPQAVSTAALNPFSGLYGSDYARFLPAWLDTFGDALRIGYLDDLTTDPVSFYRVLAEWVGVTASYFTDDTSAGVEHREGGAESAGGAGDPTDRPGVTTARSSYARCCIEPCATARVANMTDVAAAPATDDAAARDELRAHSRRGGPPWPTSSGGMSWSGCRAGSTS